MAEAVRIELLEEHLVEPGHIEFLEETATIDVRIDSLADLLHLVVDDGRIGAGDELYECDGGAEMVVRVGKRAAVHFRVFFTTPDVGVLEQCAVQVLQNARHGALCLVDGNRLPDFQVARPGKALGDDDIGHIVEGFRPSLHETVVGEHLEKIAADRSGTVYIELFIPDLHPQHHIAGIAHRQLRFRHLLHHGIRETIGQPREIRQSEVVDMRPVRILLRHRPLLPGITADQDHKRQAHRQPHRLDGGVKFIA